jgi:hypothetical protein
MSKMRTAKLRTKMKMTVLNIYATNSAMVFLTQINGLVKFISNESSKISEFTVNGELQAFSLFLFYFTIKVKVVDFYMKFKQYKNRIFRRISRK